MLTKCATQSLTVAPKKYQQDDLIWLVKSLKNLTFLRSTGTEVIFQNGEHFFGLLICAEKLRHLEMYINSRALLLEPNESFPPLATLYLTGNAGLVQRGLRNLVNWFPNLETLHLDSCFSLTDASLQILAKGLSHLRCLHLNGPTRARPKGIVEFSRVSGGGLRELHLTFHKDFSMVYLRELLLACPNLSDVEFAFTEPEDFEVPECPTVALPRTKIRSAKLYRLPSKDVVTFTSSAALHLRILDLNDCRRDLSSTQLEVILDDCACLEVLRVSLCRCSAGLAMLPSDSQVGADRRGGSTRVWDLELRFCQRADSRAQHMGRKLLQRCSEISTLCLRDADQLDLLALLSTCLPLLTEVSVVKCTLLSQTKIEGLTLPSLKILSIKECQGVYDKYLEVLAGSCPQLEDLSISFQKMEHPEGNVGQFPTFDCIQRLIECCPRLIRLLWKQCDPFPRDHEDEKDYDDSDSDEKSVGERISAAAVKAPKLERLVLMGAVPGATAAKILQLAASCPQLLRLEVTHGYGGLTEDWLESLMAACPRLAYLDLRQGNDGGGGRQAKFTDAAFQAVLRIRMFIPGPGSDFFPSRIPDPNCLYPGSLIRIKEFKYFNLKNWFRSKL
jgi:hypothetical protein